MLVHPRWVLLLLSAAVLPLCGASAAEPETGATPMAASVESIAREARPSLAVFHVADRDGRDRGIGTGFVISRDGLIATNLHVIGEGRRFRVELAGGHQAKVLEVHAADRHLDLAVVRIEAPPSELVPLELGDSAQLADGAPLVVMGNPFGLKYSVVSGVLSGRRDVEERPMLQLAIPIEPGNSGGPVLDYSGRVHGIVTMKSAVTENLGFAVPSEQLKALLAKPNPVPIERWVTIGALDARQWTTLFGANWRQRSGRILVDGAGEGFGGRSLCLSTADVPQLPFEIGASVRLEDEAGAAGIVFHADGQDRHYGFYPSAGKLRLTCFDGPTVFEWRVLRDEPSSHYRPGKWNDLRVRVDAGHIQCFVNGQAVFDVRDESFSSGRVGLAKFRDTQAEFRRFQVGPNIESASSASPEQRAAIESLIHDLPPLQQQMPDVLQPLVAQGAAGSRLLIERAEQLEQQAEMLRATAADVRLETVLADLRTLIESPAPDLLRGALLIARLDDAEVDVEAYAQEVERMAREIRDSLPDEADATLRFEALNRYLFQENGYHGSRHEYYHRANSYLNRVVDDREGLPITLSVLYIELARRLELTMEGVGLPGHFIVRWQRAPGDGQLVDVFDGGKLLGREDAAQLVREHTGEALTEDHLAAVATPQILQRMLMNLVGLAQRDSDTTRLRQYLEAMVILAPDAVRFRGMRAIARFEAGRHQAALADLDWFLENEPPGIDLERIREMRMLFERRQLEP